MISSYEAAVLHMKKARSKAKGRPMKGAGWRLYQDGDEYVVRVYGDEVGRFLPDNTFMFTTDGDRAYRNAHTLSATMHRNLPFYWARFDKRRYRVDHRDNVRRDGTWWLSLQTGKTARPPEVYHGLKFNLFDGKCLNPKPDWQPIIDPEKRKEWLAALRAWKLKVKVAARLGTYDKMIAAERANPTPWMDMPVLNREPFLDKLYKAIKDGDCSPDLIHSFIVIECRGYHGAKNSAQLYKRIEKVLTSQSRELRERFGVFRRE